MGSRKPCPGCGKIVRDRRADQVCNSCAYKLREYDEVQAKLGVKDNECTVVVGQYPHWNTYLTAHERPRYGERHAGEKIRDAFHALVKSVMRPAALDDRTTWRKPGETRPAPLALMGRYEGPDIGVMDAATAKCFIELYALTDEGLNIAYRAGVQDGSNLLQKLANGEIVQAEFERQTAGGKQ